MKPATRLLWGVLLAFLALSCRARSVEEPRIAIEPPLREPPLGSSLDVQCFYSAGWDPSESYYVSLTVIRGQPEYTIITWGSRVRVPMAFLPLGDATVRTGTASTAAARQLKEALDSASAWSLRGARRGKHDLIICSPWYSMGLWNATQMDRPRFLHVMFGSLSGRRDRRYRDVLTAFEEFVLSIDPGIEKYMPRGQQVIAPQYPRDAEPLGASAWAAMVWGYLASLMLLTVGVRQVGTAIGRGRTRASIAVAGLAIAAGMAFLYAASVILSNALWR